ncbi:MAG: DUF2339 domain-containing protein [Synergistaceae bacterium]|jgi:uncharacterized membrane protein|nr:DUF2339 domain-containing protein [Synergistaceae bacterium]
MDDLIVLSVIVLIVLIVSPIIMLFKISGVRTKLGEIEATVHDMRKAIFAMGEFVQREVVQADKAVSEVSSEARISTVLAPERATPPQIPDIPDIAPKPTEGAPPPLPDLSERETAAASDPGGVPAFVPPAPSWAGIQAKRLLSWLFSEGNIWVTVGVMLFIAGFGLLFNYIERRGLVPFEVRLIAAAIIGICMSSFGWRMREVRRTYALILQGGGIGVLYIVLLGGAKIGSAIPPQAAVVGMVMLSAFTVILALLQNFELLALFALLGGYAAPVVVSSGSSNFVALFSIHSLLNFEILLLSLRADWRKTRWGGLIASAAVGAVWGLLRWRDEYFASVEPFLILLFVNYTAVTLIPMFRDRIRSVVNAGGVDVPMILTLPFVFLFLQMSAASHTKYGVAISCLGLGAWYLSLGRFVIGRGREFGYPSRSLLAYCVIFSNLAIPFIFKQAVSSSIWAVEGSFLIAFAAIGCFGVRDGQAREAGEVSGTSGTLACGLLLHVGAFVLYNFSPWLHLPARLYEIPLLQSGLLDWKSETSPFLLTGLLFAISAFVGSYFSTRFDFGEKPPRIARLASIELRLPKASTLVWGFALYGAVWWTLAVLNAALVSLRDSGMTAFSVLCLSAALGYLVSARLKWRAIRFLAVAPVMLVMLHVVLLLTHHAFWIGRPVIPNWFPFANDVTSKIWLNWVAAAAMLAAAVFAYRREASTKWSAVAWGAMIFAVLAYTSFHVLGYAALAPAVTEWLVNISFLSRFLPVALAVGLLTMKRFERSVKLTEYKAGSLAALILLVALDLPAFVASFGEPSYIGGLYIPIINPVELYQALFFTSLTMLLRLLPVGGARRISLYRLVPFLAFLLLNGVAARAARQYFGENVWYDFFGNAPYFQGFLAILWGLAALALIFCGKMYFERTLWAMGAGLLVFDIAKLLLVDLKNSATVVRIFAFLLLGGLFLLIGWIAPLPPKRAEPPEISGDGPGEETQ